MDAFPRVTTAILSVHNDEVWNLQWNHKGDYLATASKDKSAIIWRIGVSNYITSGKEVTYGDTMTTVQSDADPTTREYHAQFVLRDHKYQVGCVAWSLDDSILLTASENYIYMWNAKVRAGRPRLTA